MCMFCRLLFVLLYFIYPLCFLFFFNIRIHITPLYLQTLLRGSRTLVNTCIFVEFLISWCFILSTKPKSNTQITDRIHHLFMFFLYDLIIVNVYLDYDTLVNNFSENDHEKLKNASKGLIHYLIARIYF